MLREITVPHSEFLTIRIPKDYLEQEVEIGYPEIAFSR